MEQVTCKIERKKETSFPLCRIKTSLKCIFLTCCYLVVITQLEIFMVIIRQFTWGGNSSTRLHCILTEAQAGNSFLNILSQAQYIWSTISSRSWNTFSLCYSWSDTTILITAAYFLSKPGMIGCQCEKRWTQVALFPQPPSESIFHAQAMTQTASQHTLGGASSPRLGSTKQHLHASPLNF